MAEKATTPTIKELHERLARSHQAMAAVEAEKGGSEPPTKSATFEILSQVFSKVPDSSFELPASGDAGLKKIAARRK
jgi:hypothetical protein